MAQKQHGWGFDITELDDKVRPQDDFYKHASERWMKANPIPKVETRWGTFTMLRYDTEKKLRKIMQELESARTLPKGSPEQMIRDFYRSGVGMKRRNELGLTPIEPWRKKIRALQTMEDMLSLVAEFHRIGVGVLWGSFVDQDEKNSERYALHISQGGLGMPERDYYLNNDKEAVRVRTAYKAHVERLLRMLGRKSADATRDMHIVLSIETRLAHASMKKEDIQDAEKTYHKMTISAVDRLAPGIHWNQYLKRVGINELPYLLVMQPDFLEACSRMLDEVSLSDWKVYLEYHVASDFAGALSNSFVKEQFSFYGTALGGAKHMRPLWRRVLGAVNGNLGELLGQLYVKKHFPPEAKRKMNLIVDDLFTAYRARIHNLDWMTPATKKKALLKLSALNRKIGYPDKWKNYRGLVIKPDDYVGNLLRTTALEHKRQLKKLRGPIDRGEWFMYPQTVNAYFAPSLNDIVFPAAILQPPFFSMDGDLGVSYGAIGMTIGHEMTHGFDNDGSKFDAKGNLKNWWTSVDRKRFEAKAKSVEKQFNKYSVHGVPVNGKLTLGENIADLGGLSIAYDAYQLELKRSGRTDIDGLTPEQRFFLGFLLFERENIRPEMEKTFVLTDTHSPGKLRINGPLSNFAPFYEAYGLKKGDKLYRTPKDREMVW